MSNQNNEVTKNEAKIEYVRGCEDTRELAYNTSNTFVYIVQERLNYILKHAVTLDDAEVEIRKINNLIYEYLDKPEKAVKRMIQEYASTTEPGTIDVEESDEEYASILQAFEARHRD